MFYDYNLDYKLRFSWENQIFATVRTAHQLQPSLPQKEYRLPDFLL